jgi:hypothetical protein
METAKMPVESSGKIRTPSTPSGLELILNAARPGPTYDPVYARYRESIDVPIFSRVANELKQQVLKRLELFFKMQRG